MRAASIAICALVLCGSPAGARAAEELSLRLSGQFVADDGISAFGTRDSVVQGELAYAHAVARQRRTEVWIEGSYVFGRRGSSSQPFDATLWLNQLTAGARLAVPILPWLVPHVRLGVGVLVGSLGVEDQVAGSAHDRRAGITAQALVGVELLLPRAWMSVPGGRGATAGLVIEGGGSLSSTLRFAPRPDRSSDELHAPIYGASLGRLNVSGGIVRAGILVRF